MRRPLSWPFGALLVAGLSPLAIAACLLADANVRTALFFNTSIVEPAEIDRPPAELAAFGYAEDDPVVWSRFLPRARAAAATATTDLARIQAIGNAVYSTRRIIGPRIPADPTLTLDDVAAAIDEGTPGQCGHLTWLMTAMARTLDIHTRQIVWTRRDGTSGHVSFEFFSRDESRWIYFDVNLNGYATRDGRALSARELREQGASAPTTVLVSTPGVGMWDQDEFRIEHAEHAFDWYVMSNGLDRFSPGRRFGALRSAHGLLIRLPYAGVRIADRVLSGRDSRLTTTTARQRLDPAAVVPRRKRSRA